MVTPLKASLFQDTQLDEVRAGVRTLTDEVPFLLLPLRLETRFMRLERPAREADFGRLETLMQQMATLTIELLRAPATEADQPGYLDKIRVLTNHAHDLLTDLGKPTRRHKVMLQELSTGMNRAGTARLLPANFTAAPAERLTATTEALATLTKAITDAETIPEADTDTLRNYVDSFRAVHDRLKNLADGKIPYTNPRNKRDLYRFLAGVLDDTARHYQLQTEAADRIRRIDRPQLDRVLTLHTGITTQVSRLPDVIANLHADANWVAFVAQFRSRVQTELPPLFIHFESEVTPKLRYLGSIAAIKAEELYFSGVQLLIQTEQVQQQPFTKFTQVKKAREKLAQRAQQLSDQTARAVVGVPQQVGQLQNLWSQVTETLHGFTSKVQAFQTNNASHAFGLKATDAWIATKGTNALGVLANAPLNTLPVHSGMDLQDSFALFDQSQKTLDALNNQAAGGQPLPDTPTAVRTLADRFRVAGRQNTVLTATEVTSLRTAFAQVKPQLTADPTLQADVLAIERGLASINAVVTDKKSSLFAEFHDRPALIPPGKITHELWVRVYPDNLFVQTHEPELTPTEMLAGQDFWRAWWIASNDRDLELGAWRQLVAITGSSRAAWIARILDPQSVEDAAVVAAFQSSKPSARTVQALQQVQQAGDALQNVNLSDPQLAVLLANLAGLNLHIFFDTATALLTTDPPQQPEQVYLLEKLASTRQRVAGRLSILAGKLNALDPGQQATFATPLAKIQTAFVAFETFSQALLARPGVDSLTFRELVSEEAIVFPGVATKAQAWAKTPGSVALPDRFVVATINGGQVQHFVTGRTIPADLALGLDPNAVGGGIAFQVDEHGDLAVDEKIKWMTDFDAAVANGMGLIIPLRAEQAALGFDQVLVLGVQTQTADQGQANLEDLLTSHHYAPDSMALVPPGTPTNNTPDEPADFRSLASDADLRYRIELQQSLFPTAPPANALDLTDGARLSAALGIDPSAFQHSYRADGRQVSNALAMNRALWHGTIGTYLDEMWDKVFTYDNIERTRHFFSDHVTGRGLVPSLRIGRQPYGILPTTVFSALRFSDTFDSQKLPPPAPETHQLRFDIRLHQLLMRLNTLWTTLRTEFVKHAGNVGAADPQQHFMTMLGLNATSEDYYFRYGVNVAQRGKKPDTPILFGFDPKTDYGPAAIKSLVEDLMLAGDFSKSFWFMDEDPLQFPPNSPHLPSARLNRVQMQFDYSRQFGVRYFTDQSELGPNFVHHDPRLTGQPLATLPNRPGPGINPIGWLLQQLDNRDLYAILNQNIINTDRGVLGLPDNSLLFLLLRQGLLSAYAVTAGDVLEQDSFFEWPGNAFSGQRYRRSIGTGTNFRVLNTKTKKYDYLSRFSYLFKDFERLIHLDWQPDFTNRPLFTYLTDGDRSKSMANYLVNQQNLLSNYPGRAAHQPLLERVNDVRHALTNLTNVPDRELSLLLTEHLDLASYRLDAWITGFANHRLAEMRQKQATGVYLGAYGWVENLRPAPPKTQAPDVPADLLTRPTDKVMTDPGNQGLIHAPSIGQAVTAAILRAGYRANTTHGENLTNRMAINLSSARVRAGLQLLEGVRSGLEVGAILGFQFERGLHERYRDQDHVELDKYILPFRKAFPMRVPIVDEDRVNPDMPTPSTQVVNGLQLLDTVQAVVKTLDFATNTSLYVLMTQNNFQHCPPVIKGVITTTSPLNVDAALRVILKEIDRMADCLDALADLSLSEGVYQIVQGNHVRAAAVLNALAEGRTIPDPQVIDTPRTGTVVTQRVVWHLPLPPAPTPPGWPTQLTPRAQAEPTLNYQLGLLLGSPDRVRGFATLSRTVNGEVMTDTVDVKLDALGLQPIDVLYLLSFHDETAASELDKRLTRHLIDGRDGADSLTVTLRLRERGEVWTPNELSFFEFETLVRALRELLTAATPVAATDLVHPEPPTDLLHPGAEPLPPVPTAERLNAGKQDIDELSSRVQTTVAAWELWADTVGQFVDNHADWLTESPSPVSLADGTALLQHLTEGSGWGVQHVYPALTTIGTLETALPMYRQLKTVRDTLIKQRVQVQTLRDKAAKPTQEATARVNALTEAMQVVFGKAFVVLPHYTPTNAPAINEQLALPADQHLLRQQMLIGNDMDTWLQTTSPVRPKMQSLETARLLGEVFGQASAGLQPVQFPYKAGDYWLGMAYPNTYAPTGDKLSLIWVGDEGPVPGETVAGLLLDEWIEILPQVEETTGLSFHYDQPNATPPQTLLLAVPPTLTGQWEWDNLLLTLTETLELAKNRAVEPDQIQKGSLQHLLPMLSAEVVPGELHESSTNPLGTQVVLDFSDIR